MSTNQKVAGSSPAERAKEITAKYRKTKALPGLAPDGTLVILGVTPDEIRVTPMDLVPSRLHLMGSPSGSRKDIRDALEVATNHDIRPQITRHSLEEAGNLLREMQEGRLRGRAVLVMD